MFLEKNLSEFAPTRTPDGSQVISVGRCRKTGGISLSLPFLFFSASVLFEWRAEDKPNLKLNKTKKGNALLAVPVFRILYFEIMAKKTCHNSRAKMFTVVSLK